MKNEEMRSGKNGHSNRILLNGEILERVDGWATEVKKSYKGMKVTRAD